MSRLFHRSIFLGIAALSFADPTFAEDIAKTPEQPTLADARAAFLKGNKLMEAEKWAEAEEQFAFATRVRNTPGLHYYIGHCREQQGLLIEALESYRIAEELLKESPAADVEDVLPEALERVVKDLPQVHLQEVPAGAALTVDGASRPLSAQFSLNPGQHVLVVIKDGYAEFTKKFSLKPGMRASIHVVMTPNSDSKPDEPEVVSVVDQESPTDPLQPIAFWSSVGVGTIGLGVGVAGTLLFSGANREIDDLNDEFTGTDSGCNDPSVEFSGLCGDLDQASKQKNLGGNLMVGGFVVAGVGVVGALATHFLWPEAPVEVQVGSTKRGSWMSVAGSF